MSLLQADIRGLEIVCAAYLSQDPVLMKELEDGVDIHSANQEAFGLPSRGIAKILKFRTIYGGSAYSFANDPEFKEVGYNEKQWQEVLDTYYNKYVGLREWHKQIVQEVCASGGYLTVPCTGRTFQYEVNQRGKFPETQIKNHPVQSLGSDLVALARVSLYNRWRTLKEQDKRWEDVKLVCTVHDSLVVDFDETKVSKEELAELINTVFHDLPANFYKMFKTEFNLKVGVEIMVGHNWKDMEVI